MDLILDSALGRATSILAQDGRVVAFRSEAGNTLESLHGVIAESLDTAGVSMSQVGLVAFVRGPGSWTGLHVSVITGKTLAQVVSAHVLPLSLLEVFAAHEPTWSGPTLAALEGKRGTVYSAAFGANQALCDWAEARNRTHAELTEQVERLAPRRVVGPSAAARVADLRGTGSSPDAVDLEYPSPDAFVRVLSRSRSQSRPADMWLDLTPDYMHDDFTATPALRGIK